MQSNCDHLLCNRSLDEGEEITEEETVFMAECLVDQGVLVKTIVDGEVYYRLAETVRRT